MRASSLQIAIAINLERLIVREEALQVVAAQLQPPPVLQSNEMLTAIPSRLLQIGRHESLCRSVSFVPRACLPSSGSTARYSTSPISGSVAGASNPLFSSRVPVFSECNTHIFTNDLTVFTTLARPRTAHLNTRSRKALPVRLLRYFRT